MRRAIVSVGQCPFEKQFGGLAVTGFSATRRSRVPVAEGKTNRMDAKESMRNAVAEQLEILKAMPPNERDAALNHIRDGLRAAEQIGYERMRPEQTEELENLKLRYPSLPEACVGFLRGCLAGTLSLDNFEQWFEWLFEPSAEGREEGKGG